MIDALAHALQHNGPLEALPDRGLGHWHFRLVGTGRLVRVPKQSQVGLAPHDHLAYEAACFERASRSGHVPQLHQVIAPSPELPRGALVVDEVIGRPARLPDDLSALAQALAAVHALPLPTRFAPLRHSGDALAELRDEIDLQAQHLPLAAVPAAALRLIEAERTAFASLCTRVERPPKALISFDAHPGNFLIRADGRAMLVDLEKARYGPAPLDLAHATLYTSTTWDVDSHAVLTLAQIVAFHEAWSDHLPGAAAWRPWIAPLRRAMWLWSISWCAKWRVLSQRPVVSRSGEDWSSDLSTQDLVAHVRGRVDHYLSADVVVRVCDEANALEAALA